MPCAIERAMPVYGATTMEMILIMSVPSSTHYLI